jgi:hypothetical protein
MGRARRLTRKDDAQLRQMFRAGRNRADMAWKLSTSVYQVTRRLRKLKLARDPGRPPLRWGAERAAVLQKQLSAGRRVRDIQNDAAALFGLFISLRTLEARISDLGLARPRGRPRQR